MAKNREEQAQDNRQESGRPDKKARADRTKRVPLGSFRRKLTVDDDFVKKMDRDGYKLRWINDDGRSRIEQAQQAGYSFVTSDGLEQIGDQGDGNTDPGQRISQVVGTTDDGAPMRAYLMAIPKDWYEEDQREKQKHVDEIDKAIKGGRLSPGEKQYVPEGGISYNP